MDVALEEGDRAEAGRLFQNAKTALAKVERLATPVLASRALCPA